MYHNLISQNDERINILVSYGTTVHITKLVQKPFNDILHQIQTGDKFIDTIQQIRDTSGKKERNALKEEKLPVFSMAHYKENARKNKHLLSTQHLLFDFDGLDDRLDEVRKRIESDPTTFVVFLSPSGNGLKLICRLDKAVTDPQKYTDIYIHFAESICNKYGIKYDPTKDAARVCFMSYDPDVYVNPDAVPLQVVNKPSKKKKKDELISTLNGVDEGNRTHTLTQHIGVFLKHNMPVEITQAAVLAMNKQNNPVPLADEKVKYTVNDMYARYLKEDGLADYWSYGTDMLEIGIIDSKFYMEKNSEKKIYTRVGAVEDVEKDKVYQYLVKEKHIPHLARVNHKGVVNIDTSLYKYNIGRADIDVYYAALPIQVQDNDFIEKYLEKVFGTHKQFIKEWLAVFCYTNYEKLPFLILTGKRGCGKNTFAEMVAEIYPTISMNWNGEEKNFNPEVEMKLLVADETLSNDPHQYKMLKKYSGQKDMIVNHKFLKPYKVLNNMNVIILSNSDTPIKVEREEVPDSEENNQFFVYKMPPFNGIIDKHYREKLVERLGYYIRTELKTIFDNLQQNGNRYSIRTPITAAEKALFVNNASDVESVVDRYIMKMVLEYESPTGGDEFKKFFDLDVVPVSFIDRFMLLEPGVKKKDVIRNMVDRGLITSSALERKSVDKERAYGYSVTSRLKKEVTGICCP